MPNFIKKFFNNLENLRNNDESISYKFLDILIDILFLKDINNETIEISKFLNFFGKNIQDT